MPISGIEGLAILKFIVCGEQMEITYYQQYNNGTIQMTIKRKENTGD